MLLFPCNSLLFLLIVLLLICQQKIAVSAAGNWRKCSWPFNWIGVFLLFCLLQNHLTVNSALLSPTQSQLAPLAPVPPAPVIPAFPAPHWATVARPRNVKAMPSVRRFDVNWPLAFVRIIRNQVGGHKKGNLKDLMSFRSGWHKMQSTQGMRNGNDLCGRKMRGRGKKWPNWLL